MRLVRPVCFSMALLATAPAQAQAPAAVKAVAGARVTLAHSIAADAEIRKAVAAKNAEGESQQAIEAKDREWSTRPDAPLRKAQSGSPCASRLRQLIAADSLVVEAILMDVRGANVCVSRETSDYFQGDEDKWRKTLVEGRDPFVDEPAFDASTATYAVQLSVPVSEGGRRVGALTLTLKVRKDAVAPAR